MPSFPPPRIARIKHHNLFTSFERQFFGRINLQEELENGLNFIPPHDQREQSPFVRWGQREEGVEVRLVGEEGRKLMDLEQEELTC
jgi:hypothetical protein